MAEDKKIIVDEDWKSQVQAEKEAAARQKEPAATASSQASGPAGSDQAMPPASLELLLTTLATEALMALGQVPHPMTGQSHFQPNQARYLIDMIEVLRDKTKGNLSPAEQQLIDTILHQLRMAFLESGMGTAAGSAAAASSSENRES